MITASELGKLAARVKMAADPTFRKSDTVMPSVPGSSAPKPPVAPYAPNPKSGPGGGKENWDYAPKKPNAVSPKMPTSAPTPTPRPTPTPSSSDADETTRQRFKKLRESLSDTAISPATQFEFDRAMKKIPEPAAAPPAAVPPAADNRPAVPPTSRPGNNWYETWRDDVSQKARKLRKSINIDGFTDPTEQELIGYPSARLIEEQLLKDKIFNLYQLERAPVEGLHQRILDNTPEFRLNAVRGTASNLLPNTPALLGGLIASATGNPVAGAQIAARGASNIAGNVYNMPTYLSPSKLKIPPQKIQEELRKKMQERLAENDRYEALEKFVEYPDQTKLQKLRELRAMPARTPPVFPTAEFSSVPINKQRDQNSELERERTTSRKMQLMPFADAPDGILVGERPFLDKEQNETSDNRAKLIQQELDLIKATTPYLPGNGDFKTYLHPDIVHRRQNSSLYRISGAQNDWPAYSENYYNHILNAHKDGNYPTRAERERAKPKEEAFKIHFPELADPNTHLGSSQRLRRMLYDPTDEGINPDVIPPDVLRRNDPAEIRYHAQKAKRMQGR